MAGNLSVAVTGGAGFVGRAVLNALLRRGAEVAAVTRDGRRLSDFEGRVRVLRETSRTREAGCAKFWLGTMF